MCKECSSTASASVPVSRFLPCVLPAFLQLRVSPDCSKLKQTLPHPLLFLLFLHSKESSLTQGCEKFRKYHFPVTLQIHEGNAAWIVRAGGISASFLIIIIVWCVCLVYGEGGTCSCEIASQSFVRQISRLRSIHATRLTGRELRGFSCIPMVRGSGYRRLAPYSVF